MQVMDFEKVIPGFLIGGLAYTSSNRIWGHEEMRSQENIHLWLVKMLFCLF